MFRATLFCPFKQARTAEGVHRFHAAINNEPQSLLQTPDAEIKIRHSLIQFKFSKSRADNMVYTNIHEPFRHAGKEDFAPMASLPQSHPTGLTAQPRVRLSLLEKSNLIDATPWAHEFSFSQIKRLAAYIDVYQVPKDMVLFYEGDKSAYLVLIVTGQVYVMKFDAMRNPRHIATLGPGKTIGEMCIIDGEPRSASAVTATDTTLLVMTAEKFNILMEEWPRVGAILVLKIAKLMSQYLRRTSCKLIDNLQQ